MTTKEELSQEIESAPEALLAETLNYLRYLKATQPHKAPTSSQPIPKKTNSKASTGGSLLKHLEAIGSWQGDDLEECLASVYATRSKSKFYYDSNPFE